MLLEVPLPETNWFALTNYKMYLPFEQTSLSELQQTIYHHQDTINQQSITTARLIQLTYNMNRGKSPALNSISAYLPFGARYELLTELSELDGISTKAAKEWFSVKKRMHIKCQLQLKPWEQGLTSLAKQ